MLKCQSGEQTENSNDQACNRVWGDVITGDKLRTPPETYQTSQQNGTEGFKGGPQLCPYDAERHKLM